MYYAAISKRIWPWNIHVAAVMQQNPTNSVTHNTKHLFSPSQVPGSARIGLIWAGLFYFGQAGAWFLICFMCLSSSLGLQDTQDIFF